MRKMLLLAIATMGATALMASPSEARPEHEHRQVERRVVIQPFPGVQVQLPAQVERPVQRKRVIVIHKQERSHLHRDLDRRDHRGWDRHDHHGWDRHERDRHDHRHVVTHPGSHREVIVVRR